jgi:hypothetical protein
MAATNRPTAFSQVVYEYGKPLSNDIDRKTKELQGKPVLIPLSLPQFAHGLTQM